MVNSELESIHKILPMPIEPLIKPPRYTSKCLGRVEDGMFELGVPRRLHATMGAPHGASKNDPGTFLRRKSSLGRTQSTGQKQERVKMKLKADIPRRDEKPVMGLFTDQNYVTKNAVEVILAKPKKQQDPVDWTKRNGYGKVPNYLQHSTTVDISPSNHSATKSEDCKGSEKLSLESRDELLGHLKNKWATVNAAYQKLTFTLDTPAKKKRKERYESLLTEIEKDIQLLEKHDNIIITKE